MIIQPKEQHLTQAKKVVNNLEKMNLRDTGCLSNAYPFEKKYSIALATYYKLRRYDPSAKFIITYRSKEILKQYKIISEERLDMKHALYKIYGYLHNMNEETKPVNKLNKNNDKDKNNINNTK